MSAATFDNLYKIIEGEKHVIIYLNRTELPQNIPEDFIEYAKNIILKPINIIVNFFITEYVPLTWMGIFTILNNQLSDLQKKLVLINVTENLKQCCPHTDFNTFLILESVQDSLEFIENTENSATASQKNNYSFVRAFTNAMINTLFIQANTPLIRQKIFVKKNQDANELQGDVAGIVFFTSEDFFYSLAITCNRDTYLKIISTMLKDNCSEVTTENANGLAEIVNIVIGQVKNLQRDNFKLEYSLPVVHLSKIPPKKQIIFKGNSYWSYQEGESIVIPFQSNKGQMYIEIWYKKEFESFLLR
ncbi:MAG: chemotaxis protein CheX [Oligoflexia bacterium]|nr:chemotaxis protein CheX [Oligoflexia bacterium]